MKQERRWQSYAIALCLAVILYVFMMRFGELWAILKSFFGFFTPVILGCVIAYLINPLSMFLSKYVFGFIKKKIRLRTVLSNLLAFLVIILFLVFALWTLIPQIIESIKTFSGNLDGYMEKLNDIIDDLGIPKDLLHIEEFISSSENLLNKLLSYLESNITNILSASVTAGKSVFRWLVAFIMSIYLLADKDRLKAGASRLLSAVMGGKAFSGFSGFLAKCDKICSRYVIFNIIDSFIVGFANALCMTVAGMQYVGLVSFCVAITNLIPTFGPVVGAVIGAFILLMVKPMHALIFLIFTLVLQTLDGYVIKPRLFGTSLGVSGLWILIAIMVFGGMFGVAGILLAIPAVAIIDLIYNSYLLPWLEKRRRKLDGDDRV